MNLLDKFLRFLLLLLRNPISSPLTHSASQSTISKVAAMKIPQTLVRGPTTITSSAQFHGQKSIFSSNKKRVSETRRPSVLFLNCVSSNSGRTVSSAAAVDSTSPVIKSGVSRKSPGKLETIEEYIEKIIYRFRFMAILGVLGSLIGSILCFIKGCTYVTESFKLYMVNRSKVIQVLVEAIDVYLLGTVMLVFGMGLYELFISNLGSAGSLPEQKASYSHRSSFFGLFALKERPRWLDIKTVNELKTKLGHVIVMLLLIGLFDKSKKAAIQSPMDLLCFCASVFLSSSCLFLLSKLNEDK